MILSDQQKKMLARIAVDSPVRGDGQELLKLLTLMEIDALREGRILEDRQSRLMQGQSMGFVALRKHFEDAMKS